MAFVTPFCWLPTHVLNRIILLNVPGRDVMRNVSAHAKRLDCPARTAGRAVLATVSDNQLL